jgi:YD repeat-containing protein
MPRGPIVSAILVAFVLLGAAPALAHNEEVQVVDNAFMPSAVAITPGEGITWINPGTNDHHNVTFDDGTFSEPPEPSTGPWSRERVFANAGTFRYYCEEHGGPGGQGMSGTVFVNATASVPGTPPSASFTASPSPALVGQDVSFNATGSSDPDGSVVEYEWDLDGDGTYETNTGSLPIASRSYSTPQTVTVGLRVTDNLDVTGETTRSVTVTAPPTASFTVSPGAAEVGQTVAFNGAASSDDGSIVKYEWDLDGDGSYEIDTGTTPTASRTYTSPATLTVRLRVTDDAGFTAETTRSLQISAAAQPGPPPQQPPPAAGGQTQPTQPSQPNALIAPPPSCTGLMGARRAACIQRTTCAALRGSRRARCIQRSCRWISRSRRGACIRKSCRYLKRSKRTACRLTSCRTLSGARKRACVRRYSASRRR